MSDQALEAQEKKELEASADSEKTQAGRYYLPYTDIHETDQAVVVSMDMPGVRREDVGIELDRGVLTVSGKVSFSNYEGLTPLYTGLPILSRKKCR